MIKKINAIVLLLSILCFSNIFAASVSTRIKCQPEFEKKRLQVRVTWLGWNSSFRNTELQIGDFIVGWQGPNLQKHYFELIDLKNANFPGSYLEEYFWEKRNASEGAPVDLIVLREDLEIKVEGRLLPDPVYFTPTGKRALGDNGPDVLGKARPNDKPWSFWYEDFIKEGSNFLDGLWNKNYSFNNRVEYIKWIDYNEFPVDYYTQKHPGQFATQLKLDYEKIKKLLAGETRTVLPESQKWRLLSLENLKIAKAAGLEAFGKVRQEKPQSWINPFPAPNPITGQFKSYVGKQVELPKLGEREFAADLGKSYLVVGQSSQGYYIVENNSRLMDLFFDTFFQVKALYWSELSWEFYILGTITDQAKMVTYRGRAVTGLIVEPFAVYIGDKSQDLNSESPRPGVFVDLRGTPDVPIPYTNRKRFAIAAENKLASEQIRVPGASDSASAVMEAFIKSLKYGQVETFGELFATWNLYLRPPYPPLYYPQRSLSSNALRNAWEFSRSLLFNFKDTLTDVIDTRVISEGKPYQIYSGDESKGIPAIYEVQVLIEHIGLFNGEYKTFTNGYVKRLWKLQRQNQGPWRITEIQHL